MSDPSIVDPSRRAFEPANLVELLRWRALRQAHKHAYTYLEDGETQESRLTYADLDSAARLIAAHLQDLGMSGERALLLYPPGLDYIAAFFGCLYAGVVAVPAFPPRLNRPMPRIQAIVADSQASAALTTTAILSNIENRLAHSPELAALKWLDTERLEPGLASEWQDPKVDPDALAFLQYTSGSTSTPKGVMLSHGNLIHNLKIIRHGFQIESGSTGVFWLPSYHDMGLIGGILEPMFVGEASTLMSPASFLQRPRRWLQAITAYKGTISGAPNFAYELCVEKISPEERQGLDLSSWKTAFCGAEPVRLDTLERFAEAFAPHGFRREAFYPCYGLAEGTLIVAGGQGAAWPSVRAVEKEGLKQNRVVAGSESGKTQVLVSSGGTLPGQSIVIVDPETGTLCPTDQVGEIWVAGPSVASGYWGQPDETARTFGASLTDGSADSFLRTGDLGFLSDGELYVTGRLKDLIIIRGRNHYPQDIERTVAQSHPAFQLNAGAAFSVDVDGEERLVVAHELARQHRNADVEDVFAAVRRSVAEEHELQLHAAVLLKPLSIPMTSSGKVRRHACRAAFVDGSLEAIAVWKTPELPVAQTTSPRPSPQPPVPEAAHTIRDWLIGQVAARTGAAISQIDPEEPFALYGLDSVDAVSLTGELEIWLNRRLSPTLAWDYPSIGALARHLAGAAPQQVPAPAGGQAADSQVPIAVVGIGCRFPGAPDPDAFWQLLRDGVDAVREVPADRWDADHYYAAEAGVRGKANTRWGSFLEDVAGFDPVFFGIAPREAARIDPQQRLLLEVAWEALEHAGQAPDQLAGSSTGVFVGISSYDYSRIQNGDPARIDAYTGTGNAHSIAANRLSYTLDLRGPSMAVDTACSSSLVAVHLALQSLRGGEIDLALAAGVNLILSPELTIAFSQARMMAADGRCKTFDAAADGYVRGEGCGVLVLKRLPDALRDGDPVLALLRGSAVNQDGRSNGLTAPNGPSQQAVIRRALADAGVRPSQIGYIEAHGTGTPLGDPIEIESLRAVLEDGRSEDQTVAVGSVKTNIGHLEAAAGVAGLMKVVLALVHEEIPPHLHFHELNPYISLEGSPLEIAAERRGWARGEVPRLAGVSSFGFGGTNAHVVVSEAPVIEPPDPEDGLQLERPLHLLTLSAKNDGSLRRLADAYRRRLSDLPEDRLADFCFSANGGRADFEHRLAATAKTSREMSQGLAAFAAGGKPAGIRHAGPVGNSSIRPAFLFTGQGSQYPGMGRELYDSQPAFRQALDRCADGLAGHLDRPLLSVLYPESTDDRAIDETRYTQPALFAVEFALAEMWRAWGIQPAAVLGHSVGEYVAACLAGVFPLEDALQLIALRGRLMQALPAGGGMAAVFADTDRVHKALEGYEDRLALAAANGPENNVISGEKAALAELVGRLEAAGIQARMLNVSHAFHSPLMDAVLADFRKAAQQISFQPPQIPMISNLTGALIGPGAVPDAEYWCRHMRETVLFDAGVKALADLDCDIFLEIGPNPVLTGMGKRALAGRAPAPSWHFSLREGRGDWESVHHAVGALYVRGASIDWLRFEEGHRRQKLALPTYPFQRQRYWLQAEPGSSAPRVGGPRHPVLGERLRSPLRQFETRLDLSPPADPHVTFKELAHAAAVDYFGPGAHTVETSGSSLPTTELGAAVVVQTVLTVISERAANVEIHAALPDEGGWRLLARYAVLRDQQSEIDVSEDVDSLPPTAGGEATSREMLLGVDEAEQPALVVEHLRGLAARVLGLETGAIQPGQRLDAMGLDSLMAVEFKNEVEKTVGVSLPVISFLEGPTLEEIGLQVMDSLEAPETDGSVRLMAASELSGNHPLSYNQQALWFLRELSPPDVSFNVAGAVAVHGQLDVSILRQAFQDLVDRHAALRTVFAIVEGEPRQRLLDHLEAPFEIMDASEWSDDRLGAYLNARAFERFDLQNGPAFRVVVLLRGQQEALSPNGTISTDQCIVLLAMDHIVSDFWSISVLAGEVLAAYRARTNGTQTLAEPLPIQYVDYVRWQHEMLASPEGARLLDYWRAQLGGNLPALDLPTDRPRQPLQTFKGAAQTMVLDNRMTEGLKKLAGDHNATLYMVLLAAFQALLHRYTGQEDLLVGSVTAGRGRPELAGMVGYFVNPIVLRADLSDNPSFASLLDQVRKTVLGAIEHESYPPALLAEKLGIRRDASRPPLFEVMFIFQKTQLRDVAALSPFALGMGGARLAVDGLDMKSVALDGNPAQFDLTLMMAELEDGLGASLQYNADLFEPATMQRMLAHYETLLNGILAASEAPVSGIPLLDEEERRRILVEWNDTQAEPGMPGSLHRAIEAQAARSPDRPAVVFEGQTLTYRAMDQRANQLARHLRGMGVGPGSLVGICMERSLDLMVGLLGILKAGGAYIPLDPAFPTRRLELMLEAAQPHLVLTESDRLALLPKWDGPVVLVDQDWAVVSQLDEQRLENGAAPDDLAYVIFTSGSTGIPKGVQVSHRSVMNFLNAMRSRPGLSPGDRLLAVTTLSFDIAVLELFLPLVTGAQVEVASRAVAADGFRLLERLAESEATVMQATPATWRMLLAAGWEEPPAAPAHGENGGRTEDKRALKILCGGEPLPRELADQLLGRASEVWNMYGPTETTVWSTIQQVSRGSGPVSIGKPIANTKVYVLDAAGQPVPTGTAGELYIGGLGVARGYLNQDELTAERFLLDPFSTGPHARMYRTGDLARFRPDGSLVFLGRVDQQVKVRGFRIELGEIEAALTRHPAVSACVVAARGGSGGDMRLVGYTVLEPAAVPPPAGELNTFLKRWLPDYMLPAAFVELDAIPQTPNGKLDRRRLPEPPSTRPEQRAAYVAPRTAQEAEIADYLARLLDLEKIGVNDDFFELGGNSLLATRLIFILGDHFGVRIPLARLFETPTIAGLSDAIAAARLQPEGERTVLNTVSVAELSRDVDLDPAISANGLQYEPVGEPAHIFLTGATGFVGAFLLHGLLERSEAVIHCLVRASDRTEAETRIRENLKDYSLWDRRFKERILPVLGDLGQPRLGIPAEHFDELAGKLDVLYHNGAMVNLVYPYRSHKPANVDGTVEILRLAARKRIKPVHFVSSLSVLLTPNASQEGSIAENADLVIHGVPMGGYAQSKWVSEQLVRAAGARGIPVTVFRPGPISGHSHSGAWNEDDLMFGLLAAALALGSAPDLDVILDIVPVDYVADAIVHISRKPDAFGKIYHLVAEEQINYAGLVSKIADMGFRLRTVPYLQWKRELLDLALENPKSIWQAYLPLIAEVNEEVLSMPGFDQSNTQAALSDTAIRSGKFSPELLALYLKHFQDSGKLRGPANGGRETAADLSEPRI